MEVTGPFDASQAAEDTIDPLDSAELLEVSGYVEGYASSYSHRQDLFFVQSIISVFDSARSARSFMTKELQDLRRYQGQDIEGAVLRSVAEFDASALGGGASGVRVTAGLTFADIIVTSVIWLHETAVLSVDVISVEQADYNPAALRLAQRMDARVKGIISGQVTATPSPTAPPAGNLKGREAAISQGYDLQAMSLSRLDISIAAIITSQGYDELTESVATYNEEIAARALTFDSGTSELVAISLTISLEATPAGARSTITLAKGVNPAIFSQAMGEVFTQMSGIEPDELTSQIMQLPPLGDDSIGLAMNVKTASGNFDAHVVVFSRGRVMVQIVLVGPEGEVKSEDTINLVKFVEEKVVKNSPA